MAQVPRAIPVPVTPAVFAGRGSVPVRPTASEPTAIEELAPEVEARFDVEQYVSADYGPGQQGASDGDGQGQAPWQWGQGNSYNLVATSSTLFTDMFASVDGDDVDGFAAISNLDTKGFSSALTKAINVYETNTKLASGTLDGRGLQLSFLL